ncbi:hypothetical protein RIF29_35168 [Crotalaria pallida]|uniref:Uncharacterized protein n=1 Tax=Crotalaria pallida TaxID=3830 RepID=A0AAN9E9N2_CROPI
MATTEEGMHSPVTVLANKGDSVEANPNDQNMVESIPANIGEKGIDGATIGEPTHGEWLVVTRKKRNKPKNSRPCKSNDKERVNSATAQARVHGARDDVGPAQDFAVQHVDNMVKCGPGKRSRMKGKHATPTHILLRNAGVKNIANEPTPKTLPKSVSFQAGNFGVTVPRLVKDTQMITPTWEEGATNNSGMDFVPETQLVFDPGQTKFNKAFMQG